MKPLRNARMNGPAKDAVRVPVRRDPERTAQNILSAAIVEFADKGFGGARIDVIAERSGANKRMIYHYFGSKEELYLASLEHEYIVIRKKEEELKLDELPPKEAVREIIKFTFHYFAENPQFISLLNTENLQRAVNLKTIAERAQIINRSIHVNLRLILQRGAEAGVFRSGVDPVQLYISIASMCYFYFSNIHTLSVIFEREFSGEEEQAKRLDHIVDVILGHLAP